MPPPRLSPERGHTFCASLHSRNALQHFTRATLYSNLQAKCRLPDWARACTVEMHFNISQEPLYTEIYRKNPAPQIEPRQRTHTLCEAAQSKYAWTCHKSHFKQKLTRRMPRPKPAAHNLCEPAQSKCMSTFHKSHFIRACAIEMHFNIWQGPLYTEIDRKNATPQTRGPHFVRACAVEMHVNISQEPSRATLYRSLQENCRGPAGAPWSSTGL